MDEGKIGERKRETRTEKLKLNLPSTGETGALPLFTGGNFGPECTEAAPFADGLPIPDVDVLAAAPRPGCEE